MNVRMFQVLYSCEIHEFVVKLLPMRVAELVVEHIQLGPGTEDLRDALLDGVQTKDQISYLQLCSERKSSQTQGWLVPHIES